VTLSDGTWIDAQQNIKGAPAVLYDAVMLLLAKNADKKILQEPTLRDFACDAFAHFKFIGYSSEAKKLFVKIGIYDDFDQGCQEIKTIADVKSFLSKCRSLRFWKREEKLLQ
jgi:catalase